MLRVKLIDEGIMMDWSISDKEIESLEKDILPHNAHFPEDSRSVIRCWSSTDVLACPRSGKTTVLLAKLKILADKMPLKDNAGICVISHTNIAINEIKKKLPKESNKIFSYPNYIGTILSFIDKFVTLPYLRLNLNRSVSVLDNYTYARTMFSIISKNDEYKTLYNFLLVKTKRGGKYKNITDLIADLEVKNNSLFLKNTKKALAGSSSSSAEQYIKLKKYLLTEEGMITFQEAYLIAEEALQKLSPEWLDLLVRRFQYVFIDEYQDCDNIQRDILKRIFNKNRCMLMRIGDPDQAIYNSFDESTLNWVPEHNFLTINTSYRYSQEVADLISKLKTGQDRIEAAAGFTGIKPVLIVFNTNSKKQVIQEFIWALDRHKLDDANGVYKVIGAVHFEGARGLKIGDYWENYDCHATRRIQETYWSLIDAIYKEIRDGNLYKAEPMIRGLLCRVIKKVKVSGDSHVNVLTAFSLKKLIECNYKTPYRNQLYELFESDYIDKNLIDHFIKKILNELIVIIDPAYECDIFQNLPSYFMDKGGKVNEKLRSNDNIYVDSSKNRLIHFQTIHGIKGETHDATLYLETERSGGSDLNRILCYFGIGKKRDITDIQNYSRKLAYVAMSRPRKLLCIAMQEKTYCKIKDSDLINDFEVIDIRDLRK